MDAGNTYGVTDVKIFDQGNKIADLKRAERMAKAKASGAGNDEIDKAAEEFESVFLSQMLQHMFAGVRFNAESPDAPGDDIYKSMLIDEYAKLMSRSGGVGVADHVKREMLKLQEVK